MRAYPARIWKHAAYISPTSRLHLAYISPTSRPHLAHISQVRASYARQLERRAEAWDAERLERERCAEHEAGRRGRAAAQLARARVEAAAAARRELGALRREMAALRGVVLVIGPPCSGKTTRCEALAAQLGLTHASLPTLLQDFASEIPPSEALPPGGALELLRRAVPAAQSGVLLLEVPAQAGLLPSLLLLLPPPLLLLLIDAPDEVSPSPNPNPPTHRRAR